MAWNGENPGSNPVGDANRINNLEKRWQVQVKVK